MARAIMVFPDPRPPAMRSPRSEGSMARSERAKLTRPLPTTAGRGYSGRPIRARLRHYLRERVLQATGFVDCAERVFSETVSQGHRSDPEEVRRIGAATILEGGQRARGAHDRDFAAMAVDCESDAQLAG